MNAIIDYLLPLVLIAWGFYVLVKIYLTETVGDRWLPVKKILGFFLILMVAVLLSKDYKARQEEDINISELQLQVAEIYKQTAIVEVKTQYVLTRFEQTNLILY